MPTNWTERQEDWLIQPSKGVRSYSAVPHFLTLDLSHLVRFVMVKHKLINSCVSPDFELVMKEMSLSHP